MFKIFKPIKTILLIVVFLSLTVVASVNFNMNQENKEEMQTGFLWQSVNKIITTILSTLNFLTKSTIDIKEEAQKEKDNFVEDEIIKKSWLEFKEKVSKLSFKNLFKKENNTTKTDKESGLKSNFLEIVDETKTIIIDIEKEFSNLTNQED